MAGASVAVFRGTKGALGHGTTLSTPQSQTLAQPDLGVCLGCLLRRPGKKAMQLGRSGPHPIAAGLKVVQTINAASESAMNEANSVGKPLKATVQKQEKKKNVVIPLAFSLDQRKVDVRELAFLLAAGGLSTGLLDKEMSASRWNLTKLQRAVDNSTSVVAAFTRSHLTEDYMPERPTHSASHNSLFRALADEKGGGLYDWWDEQQTKLLGPLKLVGFARTTSDSSLVGAIHDVAVAPCAQGQGIGKRLMKIAVRELVRRGIDDIAVLSDNELRPFFEDCGFGPDQLESTFMFYTSSRVPPPLTFPYPVKRPGELFNERTN